MQCKKCNAVMRLDDKDVDYRYIDYYYACDNCNSSCYVKKNKQKKVIRVVWTDEDGRCLN
ncbi:hypothetical protein EDD70_3003 [Hydrogenoanaerobacterium saccharovorans]|uniref:Uncharacterized protein n=1 Tax=Hydrogenoanaerobacterium saccharovorans TaxID=474960 RepID=A0A1H8EIQ0_9FIRM|nr:hypothetical protein EDD70_3003 [Hydrogenoanaerobacterium saccharovorans]SEN19451.1 hypothetical protein SAMN05216180_3034 [Hydrogenoanaerobacterium saccharovorans]